MTTEERRKKKLEYNKKYYLKNRDYLLEQKRKYRDLNREKHRKAQEKYRSKNREAINVKKMDSYYKYRDEILRRRRERYELNRDRILERRRQYTELNRERIRKQERDRYKSDVNSRIARILRVRIREALCGNDKSARLEVLIGTTVEKLRVYLGGKFREGMSWDNHGEWEIDHIHPLSSFNLGDFREQKRAFHYTNMQPLWMSENRKKSYKILD